MKEKIGKLIFIFCCFGICVLPFAGMTVARTDKTTENKTLAVFPDFTTKDGWNVNYLSELGTYFEDHFAWKNQLVAADSQIQSKVFGVSNMDTVIVGTNGWLYYQDTLDDYLGQHTASDRKIFNMANNLSIMQRYVENRKAKFLLTIAPNKNSLYGDDMPYYNQKKASDTKNMTLLASQIAKQKIAYADLFDLFENQQETLYLKRDSHWNGKGAVMAYNTLLSQLEIAHEDFECIPSVRTKTEVGDLNRMIYPLGAEAEWNETYQYPQDYSYVTETKSVEDAWIQTENPQQKGSLLMFRDSFGNTLLPLMANAFGQGDFSKGIPYTLESYMDAYAPETVIVEKVERNIHEFAEEPPIMTGNVVDEKLLVHDEPAIENGHTTVQMEESSYAPDFWKISGVLDEKMVDAETRVYVRVVAGDMDTYYEAFTVSDETDDNGYVLYLAKDAIAAQEINVSVLTQSEGKIEVVKEQTLQVP